MAADDREVERVRAKLYSILDTHTGQMDYFEEVGENEQTDRK